MDTQPLTFLVPKLLTFFSHANVHIRTYSVGCLNQFVPLMPPALTEHIDSYLQHLFAVRRVRVRARARVSRLVPGAPIRGGFTPIPNPNPNPNPNPQPQP